MKRLWTLLKVGVAVVVALAMLLVAVGGTWIYLNVREVPVAPAAYDWPKGIDDDEVARLADDVVSRMTLDEKLAEMTGNGIWRFVLGMLLYEAPLPVYSGGSARLGLPPISFTDGPKGVIAGRSTAFPVAMARAATWDVDLERRVGDVFGKESRAQGANYFGGVCINLVRHPSMGRAQETYGEDPWLMGEMAVAVVAGVQRHNVMACAKHYALNSMETKRYVVDVALDERTLREVYLPHFRKLVDHGVASIMSAYNRVRGEYCGESRYLLTTILRDDWGFQGFVTSDWSQGVYDGLKGVKAGLDVEMPAAVHYGDGLRPLIETGTITPQEIDAIVTRIVRTKLRYVTREDPMEYGAQLAAAPEHTRLAREVAEQGMVLLRNEGALLPLDRGAIAKLAVVGHLSDVDNTGDRGSSNVSPPYVVTPVEGMRAYLGSDVELLHATGDDLGAARAAAEAADVVLVVAGMLHGEEGEFITMDGSTPSGPADKRPEVIETAFGNLEFSGGDRVPLSLKPRDLTLIEAVAAANPKTIVALIGGSAISVEQWHEKVPAIVMAWYFGMEGANALPRVLFGDVNPSGKLPFTVPIDAADLPPFDEFAESVEYGYYHGYTLLDKEGRRPRYAFGYGLSYTTFAYDELRVDTPTIAPEGTLKASVKVSNTGTRAGAEVAQLYVGFAGSPVDRPVKLLRDFAKVALEPGDSARLEFEVPAQDLAWYDPDARRWRVEAMTYQVYVGGSSRAEDLLKADFAVVAPRGSPQG